MQIIWVLHHSGHSIIKPWRMNFNARLIINGRESNMQILKCEGNVSFFKYIHNRNEEQQVLLKVIVKC